MPIPDLNDGVFGNGIGVVADIRIRSQLNLIRETLGNAQ
jgi:hypothetical protein